MAWRFEAIKDWLVPQKIFQKIVDSTGLCSFNKDGNPRRRNHIGKKSWAWFTYGTTCNCCIGVRIALIFVLLFASFVLNLLLLIK
jgi:hypothetical protein